MVSPYLNLPTLTYALLPGESTVEIPLQSADDLALWCAVIAIHFLVQLTLSRLWLRPSPDWGSSRSNHRDDVSEVATNPPMASHRKRAFGFEAAEGSDGWRLQIWWKRDS